MELWRAIFTNVASKCEEETVKALDIETLFEKECYKLLEEIKLI